MLVFVVNAGSSTLKCQLIETDGKKCLMKALAEKIGNPDSSLSVKYPPAKEKKHFDTAGLSIAECLEKLLGILCSDPESPIHALSDIDAVGNRIVSGGEYFKHSVLIDDENFPLIQKCEELAPLHNPPADACIIMLRKLLPNTPQAAVFDTAFHKTMPPRAYMYPLPLKYYDEYRIRRYGAHGTSHRYASQRAADMLGRKIEHMGIITCHLGSGGSICAVSDGKSIDTTMGFTPLEGLMMGTRSGSIDPAIVTYLMRREDLSYNEMDAILNKESGVLGISGISSDMRDVTTAAHEGNERAQLAIDMYVYAVQKAIGSYFAVMTHTDAVVLTAGVGENSAELRERIFAGLAHMGMILDKERNDFTGAIGEDRIVSIDDSPIKIIVVTADEETRIARDTAALVSGEDVH